MDFILHFYWLFPVILNIGGETHKSRQIHVRSRQINVKSTSDHVKSTSDHVKSTSDHVKSTSDHVKSTSDPRQITSDHVKSTSDHVKSTSDHVVQLTYFCLSHAPNIAQNKKIQYFWCLFSCKCTEDVTT